jgi:hypothetical protein
MQETLPDFLGMLKILANQGVDYIIVGGVSAVLQGAPVTTNDLDIVYSRTSENLDRLLEALTELDAYYRYPPKRIAPTSAQLASPGHHLLLTNSGPLDVLGTIEDDSGYEDLLPHSQQIVVEVGLTVQWTALLVSLGPQLLGVAINFIIFANRQVSLEEYGRVREGMTIKEVAKFVGSPGETINLEVVSGGGEPARIVSWSNLDGSSMTVFVKNGLVIRKNQAGLH